MAQLKREGLLSCDKNEDYSEALSGNFMAMIATMPKEIMDGNYLYLEDGGKIPVYSRKLSSRYIDKMENAFMELHHGQNIRKNQKFINACKYRQRTG